MTTGLIRTTTSLIDYSPDQAVRDVRRRLAEVSHLIVSGGEDPATYAERFAADACDELLAHPPTVNVDRCPEPFVVARAASDRARLLAIDLLAVAHKSPPERIPTVQEDEDDDTRRPAFFDVLKIPHLGGVDATARRVGGFSE